MAIMHTILAGNINVVYLRSRHAKSLGVAYVSELGVDFMKNTD